MLVPRLISQRSLWSVSTFQLFFAGSYFLLLYCLPIYFQNIIGANPIKSGVDNLSMVITAGFFVLGGGITAAKTRHAVPFMATGAPLATVGMDLLTRPRDSGSDIRFSLGRLLHSLPRTA